MENVKNEKNYGIELLRILAILFVLLLHILGKGGVYPYAGTSAALAEHPWNYKVVWTLESAAYGAVDLFALISGFVGLRSRFHIKKWIRLWAVVVFWGVAIFFLFDKCTFIFQGFNDLIRKIIPAVSPEVKAFIPTAKDYGDVIFTIGTKQYWYFNMYTMLFMLTPILNAGIAKLNKKKMTLILFVIFLFASVYKTIVDKDLFVLGGGYSAIWLILMYLVGATVKMYHEDGAKPNKAICLIVYLICVCITAAFRFLFDHLYEKYPEQEVFHEKNGLLISYTSPFVVIGCVCLLLLFMQIKLKTKVGKKITLLLSSASFGIYIIHVHTAIWDNYLKNRFYKFAYESTPTMTLYIFIMLIALYLFFGALEIARIYLFRFTKLYKLIDVVSEGLTKLANKIFTGRKVKKVQNEEKTE